MGRFVLLSRICRPFGARKFLNSTNPGRAPGATIFRPLRGLVERYLPKSPRWRAVLMLSAAFVSLSGSSWKRIASDPSVTEDKIDQALQSAASAALGQREGAIIVMDPQTGRVRAVVNPQLAFAQAAMPGSTIKSFTALAALRAGLIDAKSRSTCPGRFKGQSFSLPCVHADHLPPFTPSEAIAYSCNYYFATLGQRLGRDQLIETLRPFGFGQATGVAGSEQIGTLRPCETGNGARLRQKNASLRGDCDAREAIGESDHIQMTPIQLLTAYSALVNGGRVFPPRLASASSFQAHERTRVEVAPQDRAVIIEGLSGAVRYGTAKTAGLNSLPLRIIGKTGTSLPAKGFRANGWFVGFAGLPSSSADRNGPLGPGEIDLAVLVLLADSHGSEAAALAKPIFETFANEISHRDTARQSNLNSETGLDDQAFPASPRLPVSASTIRVHLVTENVTQELPLEDYVLGVMRAEGSMETEPEALKALAIVIRTFALKNRGRHAKDGYDFCSTTHCQRFTVGSPRVSKGSHDNQALPDRPTPAGLPGWGPRGQASDTFWRFNHAHENRNRHAFAGRRDRMACWFGGCGLERGRRPTRADPLLVYQLRDVQRQSAAGRGVARKVRAGGTTSNRDSYAASPRRREHRRRARSCR